MNKIILVVITLTLVTVGLTGCIDNPVIKTYEWYENQEYYRDCVATGLGQVFTIGTVGDNEDITLTSVEFYGHTKMVPDMFYAYIYETTSMINELSHGEISEEDVPDYSHVNWFTIDMLSVVLRADTSYFLVIQSSVATGGANLGFGVDPDYLGGNLWEEEYGWSEISNFNLCFRVNGIK